MKTKDFNGQANIIGSTIQKYRELRGFSQRELSSKLSLLGINLYHSDISRIEANKLFVRDFELVAICKILNITYDQLFEATSKYFE